MLSGVILAGDLYEGRKADKRAFRIVGGQTVIERQIKEMRSNCDDITIVTNEPRLFLRHVDRDIRIISDYYSNQGVLSGMHAGLALARHRDVWIIGCHMPYPSAEAADLLTDGKREGYDAAIPWIGGRIYPLHGVYDRACEELIRVQLELGQADLAGFLRQINWLRLKESELRSNRIDNRFIRTIPAGEAT
ncbi:molybdenum cofactor guanylyltransferase [Paenibacillus sp. JDR-2]|uniref:molybdenum cofactor guanylyltransferase n=1 Tax=Paenibacillus sp. (strain JDR-2) TaxID=324057 RepID=UPI00016646B4|nr:molybdenum cofactor guanylyltransferase [Paenibacillus sp. JDR-2]ACT03864.1 molybdopterin-guanine dinucleotide biosynthesis protein A [Paenibacillus sp. JDR-2]